MEKWKKVEGKWTNEKGAFLSCGDHIAMKYGDDVEEGTVEYSEMWSGGYYLVLDDGAGSLPMFGSVLYATIL